jgi:diguanylate cyclase
MAVGLLTAAFASVAQRGKPSSSRLWLIGWAVVVLHFVAYAFLPAPGQWGDLANFVGTATLAWAGMLFMWASVPYRKEASSFSIFHAIIASSAFYIGILVYGPGPSGLLVLAAVIMGVSPLTIALLNLPKFYHPLRWAVVALFLAASVFILAMQHRPNGLSLGLNGFLFAIYVGCAIHFWYRFPRATAGAFITIAGFFTWASVFVLGPFTMYAFPSLHIENEVWNLPKYVVAVGMILLLLEDQIEHNKYLALHDELTGLPNRRLFQDRLANTLERSRRSGAQAALLLVDLNEFKQVNDTVGHHVGDELLKQVGKLFLGRVRRSDTVARTGGDEFSIILEEPMSRADAIRVGMTLSRLLDEPFEVNGHTFRVGASFGVAVYPDDATDPEALCIAADVRMYAAKQSNKAKAAAETSRPFQPASVPASQSQVSVQLAE